MVTVYYFGFTFAKTQTIFSKVFSMNNNDKVTSYVSTQLNAETKNPVFWTFFV